MSQHPTAGHQARKRFGQNFLHDRNIIARIVRAIGPRAGDHLVEIGPGLGAITEPLLAALGELDVVELDRDLIPRLQEQFAGAGELRIHAADALKFDFASLAADGRPLRAVGNLPYNISTPLIFHLLEQSATIRDMHFMLQREVVERLAAGPGGGDYGRLSVMVQQRCRVTPLFTIGPNAFRPRPKVESAFVRLEPYTERPHPVRDPQTFARVVSAAFAQRRKTLRNTLRELLDAETIASLEIDPGVRAETLSIEQFARLADRVAEQNDD